VVESFDLLKDIYGVPLKEYLSTREELVSLLDLGPLMDTPVRQLSLGQRMRCDLAAALLHSPSILFLDEPTIGLDAVSKLAVRDFIRRANRERGTTVILTTHDMDDIEALCNRVILIAQGRILSDGTLEDLRKSVTTERRLTVDLIEEDPSTLRQAQGSGQAAEISDPDAEVIRREGSRVYLRFYPDRVSAAEIIGRIASGHAVRDLFVENPPIEEIIASLYAKVHR